MAIKGSKLSNYFDERSEVEKKLLLFIRDFPNNKKSKSKGNSTSKKKNNNKN